SASIASRRRSNGIGTFFTGQAGSSVGRDTLGISLVRSCKGATGNKGKRGGRGSQQFFHNRHLYSLIMAIGMSPSTVPGQLREYTGNPIYGKTATFLSDKASHPRAARRQAAVL